MAKIAEIKAHKIINSRGSWTVDTRVTLNNGVFVENPVPNGASKGENEAVYLPVEKSVDIINTVINDALVGEDPHDQTKIDSIMLEMDGTENKNHLGGNSILSVSVACALVAAKEKQIEPFEHVSELFGVPVKKTSDLKFPTPVFNVLNGGKHAYNGLSFQEFMVIPSSMSFIKQVETGVNVYIKLKDNLLKGGFSIGVGDEGGFAPSDFTTHMALEQLKVAVNSMYTLGQEVFLGMDVAAESFIDEGKYNIPEEDLILDVDAFIKYYQELVSKYPLIYIEDPFYERDYLGWEKFYKVFKDKLMVVADDLVVTNPKFLKIAIDRQLANAVIVKPNQVGTITETLDFIKLARKNKMSIIISHRSGDTPEDTFIADLALAVGADFMKSGAPVRGERVAKYNRLLDIYSEIGGLNPI